MISLKAKWLMLLTLVSLAACKSNQYSSKDNQDKKIDPKRLVVSKDDWSVQMALQNDTLYRDTEKYLIEEEKKTQKEAEEWIQYMIDKKLVAPPVLFYYTEPGVVETKTFSYAEFKSYIKIVKDSVRIQIEREKNQ